MRRAARLTPRCRHSVRTRAGRAARRALYTPFTRIMANSAVDGLSARGRATARALELPRRVDVVRRAGKIHEHPLLGRQPANQLLQSAIPANWRRPRIEPAGHDERGAAVPAEARGDDAPAGAAPTRDQPLEVTALQVREIDRQQHHRGAMARRRESAPYRTRQSAGTLRIFHPKGPPAGQFGPDAHRPRRNHDDDFRCRERRKEPDGAGEQAPAAHPCQGFRVAQPGGKSGRQHDESQRRPHRGIHWYHDRMTNEHTRLQRRPFLTPIWLLALMALTAAVVLTGAVWLWVTADSTVIVVVRHA